MKSIWKFACRVETEFTVSMPSGAQILCVQVQNGIPCVWAICDVSALLTTRAFALFGTGHPFITDERFVYVGTFQLHDGGLVFHLFDRGER